ncbi:DUF2339 domain-containing protein [Catenovulum agarivorans]|uniref:DUF2339 domain-containing protein n=1 Tax=Catenovulum agarivorans TaxID=1172192 RepID=UPI000318AE5B|nr:DUF2339 domain-containing protein [Catenovulum agarivorans]
MEEEITQLQKELAQLKSQFNQKIADVELRLNALVVKQSNHSPTNIEVSHSAKVDEAPEAIFDASVDNTQTKTKRPTKLSVFITSLLHIIFEWFAPVYNIYLSYKQRGILATLLLTVTGIGLTLAGFAYLMQLVIDQLGADSKALLMCIAALFVMAVGIGLKLKTRFDEFASAIVALGLLLSYTTVYFSGSVYNLLPELWVFLLYLMIASLCHTLALWLNTKVVSALGIIGIAIMPILSNTLSLDPLYYLLSLTFITTSSLLLAYKYLGQWLANLTLAFSIASIEWLINIDNMLIPQWTVELLYLVYFAYIVASLYSRQKPAKAALIFLATGLGAFILLSWQIPTHSQLVLNVSLGFNACLAAATTWIFYRFNRQVAAIFLLMSAVWIAMLIISMFSNSYWGIAGVVEGLMLLFIGRQYSMRSSINQGQILTVVAIIYSLAALSQYFPLPALATLDGWIISLFILLSMAIWCRLITNRRVFNNFSKNTIKPNLQLIEIIWLTILLICAGAIYLGDYTGALVLVLQGLILLRAKHCKQVAIEIFAAALIIVPLAYIVKGKLQVDSFHFMQLPIYAKLATISAFLQLWLWSEFYRRYHPTSAISHYAEHARILFYLLIPVCWLASAYRRWELDILTLLWLSPALAFWLAQKVKHQYLHQQTKVLTILSCLILIVATLQLNALNSMVAISGYTAFFTTAYFLNKRAQHPTQELICSWGLITLGFVLPQLVVNFTNEAFYGFVTAAVYWAMLLNILTISRYAHNNASLIAVTNLIIICISWLLIFFEARYAAIPAIFVAIALYKKSSRFMQSPFGSRLKAKTELLLHSILATTYVLLLSQLNNYKLDLLIAPLLAIHGAAILFTQDKQVSTVRFSFALIALGIAKLAIVDAANALLWQKVILFMGIGIFILLATFWYQKLISGKVNQHQVEQPEQISVER